MEEKEIVCEECDAEFTLCYKHSLGVPTTCPWCGHEIEVEKDEE